MRTETLRENLFSLFISASPWLQAHAEARQWAQLHSAPPECQAQALTTSYLTQLLQVNAKYENETFWHILLYLIRHICVSLIAFIMCWLYTDGRYYIWNP